MVNEFKGRRPGQSPEAVIQQNLDRSMQVIGQRLQFLPQGLSRVLDIPFTHQESSITCFWACCLAVQRALKATYGDRYLYLDKTEKQVTDKARTLGLLVEGGTGIGNATMPVFLKGELGLVISDQTIGVIEIVPRVFDDYQRGNITLVNFPYEGIGHWNVVRGIVREGDTVRFDLMDPITGNHVVSAAEFANNLTHLSKDGSLISAASVSFELPKPVFKVKTIRPPNLGFKNRGIRRPE